MVSKRERQLAARVVELERHLHAIAELLAAPVGNADVTLGAIQFHVRAALEHPFDSSSVVDVKSQSTIGH